MIKALLFDKDGTLFDFQATWGQWCGRVLRDLAPDDIEMRTKLAQAIGYDLAQGQFVIGSMIVNGTVDESIELLCAVDKSLTKQKVFDVGQAAMEGNDVVPVCDLPALLSRFKNAGLRLGVATNDLAENAQSHLAQADILAMFDFIAGSDSGFGGKPEPGMIHGFCEAMGLSPTEVAMVGDSTHDLHAGRAAGCVCVGVLTGPARHEDIADHGDVILESIAHLPEYLRLS